MNLHVQLSAVNCWLIVAKAAFLMRKLSSRRSETTFLFKTVYHLLRTYFESQMYSISWEKTTYNTKQPHMH
jgi:hypothetical protein